MLSHRRKYGFHGNILHGIQYLLQAIRTILFHICINGLRDSVRIYEQSVTGIHLQLIFLIMHVFHGRKGKTVFRPCVFIIFAVTHHYRIFMTGICTLHLSGRKIDDTDPYGYEHLRIISFAKRIVGAVQDCRRRLAGFRKAADRSLGTHHEQCCRDTLSGYIRDHQGQLVLIDEEEVIEVSAHLFCRIHGCIDLKIIPREFEICRKRGCLNGTCEFQLLLDPLLRCIDVALQDLHGLVDIVGQ